MFLVRYFGRLDRPRLILWAYLAWYLAIVCRYFSPSPELWLSSLGIALMIGIALNLSVRDPGRKVNRWVVFRLFLSPFCVASYSALIKGKGFILLFPMSLRDCLIGALAALSVLLVHVVSKSLLSPGQAADVIG